MYGINETKDVLKTVMAFVEAFKAANEDGTLNFTDVGLFVNPLVTLPNAFTGISKVPHELEDLTEEEIVELTATFGDIVEDEDLQELFFHFVSFLTTLHGLLKN